MRILPALLITTILTGCIAAPASQEAKIDLPARWAQLEEENKATLLVQSDEAGIEHDWWKHFNDPVLNGLIGEAMENNKNLAIAKARIDEARAGRKLSASALFPQIDGTGNITRSNQGILTNDKPVTIAQAAVEASWEIDLFGGNQARLSQANAILESEEASRDAVMVALLAEVARNYFDLRNFEKQVAITEQNLDTQRKTLSLVKDQFEGALASDFDVQRTAAQVAQTEAQLPEYKSAYTASANRLAVLTGKAPGTAPIPPMQIALMPLDDKILVAAPASVLRERPDVRASERRFAASISASDAAVRELFPKISLLGLFGVQEASGNITSHPWSAGAGLVMPLLNFGRISAGIDAADAREQQAFLSYQQTVLEALEDMQNALARYANQSVRNNALTNAVTSNRKATELSRQQFTNGYNSLLDVLIAERDLLASESALSASDAQLRKDLVGIYSAAGGGWKETVQESQEVSVPESALQ